MLALYKRILGMGVETILVEFEEIGRIQDCHIDVAIAKKIVHNGFLAIVTKLLERPQHLGRTKFVKLEEAFDPAFAVLVAPVVRPRIPKMRVAIDHEDILPIMTVHGFLPLWSG